MEVVNQVLILRIHFFNVSHKQVIVLQTVFINADLRSVNCIAILVHRGCKNGDLLVSSPFLIIVCNLINASFLVDQSTSTPLSSSTKSIIVVTFIILK